MKALKSYLVVAGLFLSSFSYSQIYIQDINQLKEDINLNEIEDLTFIKVFISGRFREAYAGKTYKIYIDYGQNLYDDSQWGSKYNVTFLNKSNGNIVDFNSTIHIINYFEKNGWSLFDINSEARGDAVAQTSYYFKKK